MVTRGDPYAPYYELIINGATMNADFMKLVKGASAEDEAQFGSAVKFNLRYTQNYIGGVSTDLMSLKVLSPGNLVVLRGGYGSDLKELGAGYITDLKPDYSESAEPSVEVVCYDRLQGMSMNKSAKGEAWSKIRDSQVAVAIAQRNGLYAVEVDSATAWGVRKTPMNKLRGIQKRGISDLDYLKELAKLNSYDLYCRWHDKSKQFVLYFEPPTDRTKEVFEFVYGDGSVPMNLTENNGKAKAALLSFKPEFSLTSQFTKYQVHSWNRDAMRAIDYTLSMDEFLKMKDDIKFSGLKADQRHKKTDDTSGADWRQKAFGETIEIISTKSFPTEREAKEYLIRHMKSTVRDFIKGTGKVTGCQYLQSRQVHRLSNLGAFFDGKYFMNRVTHKFDDSGYVCDLDVRKVMKELV